MSIEVDGDRRRAMTSARWASVLKFTVADVELNARGRLTWRQRLRCATIGVIAFAIALAVGAEAVASAHMLSQMGPASPPVARLVAHFVASLAISLGAGYFGSAFLQDAVAGRAAVAIGPLQYVWKMGPAGKVIRHLACDGHRFDIRAPCRDAIDDDASYRVYYAPCTQRLLSLEPTGPLPQ